MSSRIILVIGFILILSTAWAPSSAEAFASWVDQVPNGSAFGCGLCHQGGRGGAPRNAFGTLVEFTTIGGNVDWSIVFNLDVDSDGFTNGEELGDPDGDGTADEGFIPTDPNDPNDFPEPSPCTTDADCGTGDVCMDGVCIPNPDLCASDDDCAEGDVCIANLCVDTEIPICPMVCRALSVCQELLDACGEEVVAEMEDVCVAELCLDDATRSEVVDLDAVHCSAAVPLFLSQLPEQLSGQCTSEASISNGTAGTSNGTAANFSNNAVVVDMNVYIENIFDIEDDSCISNSASHGDGEGGCSVASGKGGIPVIPLILLMGLMLAARRCSSGDDIHICRRLCVVSRALKGQ